MAAAAASPGKLAPTAWQASPNYGQADFAVFCDKMSVCPDFLLP